MDAYPPQRVRVPTKSYRSLRISRWFTSHCWWLVQVFDADAAKKAEAVEKVAHNSPPQGPCMALEIVLL